MNSITQPIKNINDLNLARPFLIVYLTISAATFYHSAWGFGTLGGPEPSGDPVWPWLFWWLVGGLMAVAIDVGMAVIVISLVSGRRPWWLIGALVILASGSALTQVVFSVAHADALSVGGVREQWIPFARFLLDFRIFAFPLFLPASLLIFAFAAKTQTEPTEREPEVTIAQPKTTETKPKEAKIETTPFDTGPKEDREAFRLTPKQSEVLAYLTENGPTAPGALASAFSAQPAFASRHDNPLIEYGLVVKNDDGLLERAKDNGRA